MEKKQSQNCRCGHDRHHGDVKAQAHYSLGGWITFLIGITTHPVRVDFRCETCGETFESLTDKGALRKYQGW